jgi:hypothetical protein
MKGGDISNQFAPAIAIDVDDLIIKITKPKTIEGIPFRAKRLIDSTGSIYGWLHRIFSTEYSIYIVCIRESKKEAVQIEEFIDEMMIPYSRFIKLTDSSLNCTIFWNYRTLQPIIIEI